MTKDDVIRMAREAGVYAAHTELTLMAGLERFAALVRADEREACAVAAEMVPAQWDYPVEIPHPAQACQDCAAAIRERSNP
jgi:hypothetical protein